MQQLALVSSCQFTRRLLYRFYSGTTNLLKASVTYLAKFKRFLRIFGMLHKRLVAHLNYIVNCNALIKFFNFSIYDCNTNCETDAISVGRGGQGRL